MLAGFSRRMMRAPLSICRLAMAEQQFTFVQQASSCVLELVVVVRPVVDLIDNLDLAVVSANLLVDLFDNRLPKLL